MKVFLYIRVACADQLAAADQREELERYAKDKGYEVAAAVAADGISGVHTEGIMNFLLNEAKRQDIGTILTRDTSRISRDTSSFMRFEQSSGRTASGSSICPSLTTSFRSLRCWRHLRRRIRSVAQRTAQEHRENASRSRVVVHL